METPPSVKKRGFKLEFPGDKTEREELRVKFQRIKQSSDEKMNNTDVLNTVLNFWINNNLETSTCSSSSSDADYLSTYQSCDRERSNVPFFLSTDSSIENLIQSVEYHSKKCSQSLKLHDTNMRGAVKIIKLKCADGHSFSWTSSPHLPNGKFLGNVRLIHSYLSTGLLPNQFSRLSECIGFAEQEYATKTVENDYKSAVDQVMQSSCEGAIIEEITNSFDNQGSIDIMTDARHGHRKNAKDTNVVCIGQSTHKVLKDIHITKDDDPCTQRHELLGTKKLYEYFDSRLSFICGPVNVRSHAHDRNGSVNKFIHDERQEVVNQNDTWHAGKSIEKQINKIARGSNKQHGKTWHSEITDKVLSVRTHVQYSIRNCNGDTERLRSMLDNVTDHYQNNHENCSDQSRCKTDPNYEPSKVVLRSQFAIDLLKTTIQKTCVYKDPQNYVLAMDTYYVESFNNVLNIFLDKRIHFQDKSTYKMRTNLAICHWNENVDREFTSVSTGPGHSVKKNYKKRTFDYRQAIWLKLMEAYFRD